MPLSVAGAFHTEHMAPRGRPRRQARPISVSTHDPRIPLISNKDGQVVHDGREVLKRIVGQIASPVRWDLCMDAMADLGVTGILEMPPAGTLTGIAKRNLKGVETFALKTPDQLDDARAFCAKHGEGSLIDVTPTWRMVVSPAKGTFHIDAAAAGRRLPHRERRDRRRRQPARPDRRSPRRTAAPSSSGSSRTATSSPPVNHCFACTRRGSNEHHCSDSHRRVPRHHPRHRRLPALDRVPNSEVIDAIDSSDEWIQQRSGIKQRRFATPEESVQMMSVAACREALEHAGIDAKQVDAVIVATVSHMMQTPAVAPLIATELGCEQPVAFDISAACAGFCHAVGLASDMIRGGSARYALVIGVERLSDILDRNDRGTAFIFADGAGAVVVGPSETPGIGPVVWGSDGEQFDLIRQREDWRDVVAAGSTA